MSSTDHEQHRHHHQHKRPKSDHDAATKVEEAAGAEVHPVALTNNPFMGMFNTFRDELDEHHDRRERVIKASRDITAQSKKMIFTMQRTRSLTPPLAPFIAKDLSLRQSQIDALFTSILPDIGTGTLNAYRYQRNISGGIQEYLEAVSFHHYLLHGTLLTVAQAQASLPSGVILTIADYLGGIFDLVGEMMRIGITLIATTPLAGPGKGGIETPKILSDLREFRQFFEALDTARGGYGGIGKDVDKKMSVMVACVEKVEMAVYGMIVRGSERPAGWVPDLSTLGDSGGGRGGKDGDDEII
ncbi:Translin family-domain-containing protein [Peziza echinospora]|nr:Translin family-domain-containing protein [Peziza echinospora]